MIKTWSFAKTTNILKKKMKSVIVSQNHYLNKIIDVHPLGHIIPNWLFSSVSPLMVGQNP